VVATPPITSLLVVMAATAAMGGGYSCDAAVAPAAVAAESASASTEKKCKASGASQLVPTVWPEGYKAIQRVRFSSIEELLTIMKPLADKGMPVIIEDAHIIDAKKWGSLDYLGSMLQDKAVLVKKSLGHKFLYSDAKKNAGKYKFTPPVQENQQTWKQFLSESQRIMAEGLPERMYLQETLSGHSEMAEEFVTWRWELLLRVSQGCGWGLPDSNELFVGMEGCETPLHFDERENMFVQVRGRKELVVFPFTDYTRLYPFPTTHPCDRQSMVGDPRHADNEAFPKFKSAVGHYAVLKAGDLVYLPYGWWHWLRNLDQYAMSVSFWSTTPANDLSNGVPDVFSEHMLTRVRRNLETMISQLGGQENHDQTMLSLRTAVKTKRESDPILQNVRNLLAAVKMPVEKQDEFLLEVVDGRFGIDWSKYVRSS
jgi:hypothetical protein